MTESINRRDFLKLVGITGVAGTVGCGAPPGSHLISLANPPQQDIPGIDLWYATTCRECSAGCGVMARTREGRVVKLEGNPGHPVNRGGLCIRGQAALQGLYDPDRIRQPLRRNADGTFSPATWEKAIAEIADRLRQVVNAHKKVVFLSSQNGPALNRLIKEWLRALGSDRHVTFEPFLRTDIQEANRMMFGKSAVPSYELAKSDYLLSFGADFLETWISPVAFSRAFAEARKSPLNGGMKFVQIAPRLSLTGANADEWLPSRPGSELWLALGLTHLIVERGMSAPQVSAQQTKLKTLLGPYAPEPVSSWTDVPKPTLERLAREFAEAKRGLAIGGGIGMSGEHATATQIAINLLNFVTGRMGQTIQLDEPLNFPENSGWKGLREIIDAANHGELEAVFLHNVNPVFSSPPQLGFSAALKNIPLVVSLSSFADETAELAHFILPGHTPLEEWSDFRSSAREHSLVQPAMNPLFDTKAAGDVLLSVAKQLGSSSSAAFSAANFEEYLKSSWQEAYGKLAGSDFEKFWRDSVSRGGVWSEPETNSAARRSENKTLELSAEIFRFQFPPAPPDSGQFSLYLYPSSRYYDGRGANKPWLHEIPDPITNIVWDSWVEVHPDTASRLGVAEGDVLLLETSAGRMEAPAYVYKGVRPDTVAVPIGLGHTSYGRTAKSCGANPVVLLSEVSDAISGDLAWSGAKVRISKTGRRAELARMDGSAVEGAQEFSRIIPVSALAQGRAGQEIADFAEAPQLPSLYPAHEHKQYRWGMAIDLSSCTGCNACVAACYAENNVPVVGKMRVAQGRHMAWIRINRYLEHVSSSPAEAANDVRFAPVMCQQCDNAPCEPVCPVSATMHNSEGLNVQVYNRCVGTKYCSNNCPYKVRVFNWFDYKFPEPLNLQLNPDVSVRSKGIMEKCTFCIQRIRAAKDRAKDEGRMVRDGEIAPACAQSCPTQAITFGNLLDSGSKVSKLVRRQHNYKILEELNTRPAITYLPRIRRT